ncbi:probable 28S ribosomal protein S26, mitochondrial [Vanessa atalanta]|uniref:probable 28S ribosomal protein S26, mitochondrial n=1 Tax=Vanessa atalanta TaxID=42275 RepID=UPI001FCE0E26|nr:probable 28S ribosomal protein S26, mitochondrial [Vanessa atalanta]
MIPKNVFLKRSCPLIMQIAETHRKPRWLPVAKSKIYRIPKRPEVSEEERLELLRINNNYKTQMRAIRRFYHEEMINEKSSLQSASSEMSQQLEADEWEKCVQINEKWNAQVAAEREQRRKIELAAMEDYALKRIEAKDKEFKERIARASAEIRREKELSSTFITPDNLEAAIDHALANPVDYNYAIDLRGNIVSGRDTPIVKPEKKDQKVA